ncbi:MAG: IclR family transcriptional regulator [Sphingomonas sp.]
MRKRGVNAGESIKEEKPGRGEETPNQNSALARGFAILRAFQHGDNHLGNAELAERVGVPKATVSRLTQTLAELGFLTYLEPIGKYELAPAVLSLGYAVLSRREIHAMARPLMQELARNSDVDVGLGVRDGMDLVVVESARGRYSGGLTNTVVGRRIPIALTTMGWAYVQALSAAEQSEIFEAIRETYPDKAARIEARMLEAFQEIHEKGFCTGIGEFSPAYNSIGVPLRHPNGTSVLAMNLAGPSYLLPRDVLEERWGPRLRDIVTRLRGDI